MRIKIFILITAGSFACNLILAQTVGINDNGATPNTHAILDIDISTNDKGIIIPRLTSAQRTAISGLSNTEEGLTVYDESTDSFWLWNGTGWEEFSKKDNTWGTDGNSNSGGSSFIGTIDNSALEFKTNNTLHSRITTKGQIEILNTGKSVFLGEGAGENDDLTNNYNVFIGYQSGNDNTTGYYNSALGYYSLNKNVNGYHNTAIGYYSLYSNTAGYHNIGIGGRALYSNVSGYRNSALGFYALYNNTTGFRNTANGYYALAVNTTGYSNSAFGDSALRINNTGYNNTAVGYYTLGSNNSGKFNVGIGPFALYDNTSGEGNIAIGNNAFLNNTIGDNNTVVGNEAFSIGTSYTNSTAIGFGAEPGASNTVRIGNFSVSTIGGYANWTNVSDVRFKTNIQENVAGLNFILELRPVTYQLDMDAIARFYNTPDSLRLVQSEKLKASELQSGFIAQEVELAARSIGYDFHGVDKPGSEDAHYGLRYAEFVVPLVKAIQEQQEMIEDLKKQVQELQKQIKN